MKAALLLRDLPGNPPKDSQLNLKICLESDRVKIGHISSYKIRSEKVMKTLMKICGLTAPVEAAWVAEAGADLAGMVLYFPKSKRNIDIPQAKLIMAALPDEIKAVAVTVAPTAEQARAIEAAGFDYIQIHGELHPDTQAAITMPILKAFNVSDLADYERYQKDPQIAGYVFDAAAPGSGKAFDWTMLENIPRDDKLMLLAGGLSAENVAKAVEIVRPDGVDVSSGVEYTDGRPGKDHDKILTFAKALRG